ncbi:MAG: ATP-binding protein [Chloroflexi bacterium]|nr:ATP-binding protein [Chloroflexota bacterium]
MVGSRVSFAKEDIGGEILPILTTGLYRNTLDALREYIQNAVDAAADEIRLIIDPDVVSLTDDGSGMDRDQARNAIRFGVSDKSPLENVGFRGIGIYSGFNICDSLEVYTKSRTDGNTYKLTFDFYGIRTQLLEEQERRSRGLPPALHLERLLEQSVFMESRGEEDYRGFGTTVVMSGLLPAAYGQLNDWGQVVEYLRNVVPLPFAPDFKYGKAIEKRFLQRDYRVIPLQLQIGNQQGALYRPYTDTLFKNKGRHAPAIFDIKGPNSQEFGFAWVCVNDARETIKDIKLRGLLLKKFGFSISDRQYLEPFFGRPTYSRRITGEVIVTNERLIPNAARSDFEHNSTRQEFVTQLPKLTRAIDRWANNIQESERAREVLSKTTQQLVEITEELPLLQRDRDRLLEYNAKISEINRQLSPHRKRLEGLDPEGLSSNRDLATGAGRLVKAALAESRRSTLRLETEVSKAVQREASLRPKSNSSESAEPLGIFSLVEQYLPLDETKWLEAIRVLDEVIQGQQLAPEVYQAIVDDLREQLDTQL